MQKWLFVKSEQKRAEIQGLLDLALQRSSCDTDPYKERLFIYMNDQPGISLAASGCGNDLILDCPWLHFWGLIAKGFLINCPIFAARS